MNSKISDQHQELEREKHEKYFLTFKVLKSLQIGH